MTAVQAARTAADVDADPRAGLDAEAAAEAAAAAAAEADRRAWAALQQVPDPEVPVLSVCELGIVREVVAQGDRVDVVLTPTYSGCPATEAIAADVRVALVAAGFSEVRVSHRLAPAWTTDWIGPEAHAKLRAYGIAPPGAAAAGPQPVRLVPRRPPELACPRCGSVRTERLSAFGATACKSLWRCLACREPFEHFKPF